MTIQTKLLANFLLVAAIVLACSVFGISSIRKINTSLEYVTTRAWMAANAAMETSIDHLARIVASEEYLRGDREQARLIIQRAEDRFDSKFEQLRNTQLADENTLNNIKELWNKLVKLEAKTLVNYHLKNRTKLQLDDNALIWTKNLEKLRYKLAFSAGKASKNAQEAESILVSIGLLSLADRAATNNYLSGSIRDDEIMELIEGFRSNLKRRITELAKNPAVAEEDSVSLRSIYSESERLTEKLITTHRAYRNDQEDLSYNTLRLVEAFESIKEKMNVNMEKAAVAGRKIALKSQRYFAILAVAAFAFAMLIGITITRHITQPIRILTAATQKIAKGDLAHRVQTRSFDEIGQLGRSFNQMADDILRYTEEIRQKSLQAQLANQELQVTNRELFAALNDLEKQSAILKETNRELEKATRLKSQFLANMSHELRTPMNSIIGFTNLVLRKSGHALEPRQKDNLQKVLLSAEQLLILINSILDLSKIESGRMEVYVEPFFIGDIVNQVKEVMWPLISERNLDLNILIDPAMPRIYSDAQKVKQILMNLVSNATKFTEKGEIAITINRSLATLHNHPETDCVEILVRDTGIGIAKNAQEIIFEDFRQADGSTTRKYGGTGLGLSICKRLCTLLGGSLSLAESKPQKGSTFRVLLPVDYQIEKTLTDQSLDGPDIGRSTPSSNSILAVHTAPAMLEILRKETASENIKILQATEDAYDIAVREKPALIVLDMTAPDAGELDLITRIKSNFATATIPFLPLSLGGDNKICNPCGIKDYLIKPLSRTLFVQTLQKVLLETKDKNILLVDDDPTVHETCIQFSKEEDFYILSAYNLQEARQLADETTVDLVILAPLMTTENGFDFLQSPPPTLREKMIPVLALMPKDLSLEEQMFFKKNISQCSKTADNPREDAILLIRQLLSRANSRGTPPPSSA